MPTVVLRILQFDTEDIVKIRKFYVYIAQAKNTLDSARMIGENEITYLRELTEKRIIAETKHEADMARRLLQAEHDIELKLKNMLIVHFKEAMKSFQYAMQESKPVREALRQIIDSE